MKSTSASPEEAAEALVGIDPNDTREVKYGGATFKLGVLPAGKWDVLDARFASARQAALRRAIRDLAAEGQDPDADGAAFKQAMIDPEFLETIHRIVLDALSSCLLGHCDFVNRSGQPFPFETTEDGRVTPQTLKVYAHNGQLLRGLWLHIRELNDMGLAGKKV